jgi:hypothetical protein
MARSFDHGAEVPPFETAGLRVLRTWFRVPKKDRVLYFLCFAFVLQLCTGLARADGQGFDGPAELPRVYVKSGLADTPAMEHVLKVKDTENFQDALNHSSCGDTIELQAGTTYRGKFKIPSKRCDDAHWIVIRTSAYSELPPEGTRITPCYAGVNSIPERPYRCSSAKNLMAKITFPATDGGSGPLEIENGANHYRLIGLEITREPGGTTYNLVYPEKGGISDHLVFDRVWMHGGDQDETNRGIMLTGTSQVAIVDSFFSDFKCIAVTGACVDSQAIGGGLGDHPMSGVKIVNNFLEAAGQSIVFGGGHATVIPTDIEIRHNYLFKPMLWKPDAPNFKGASNGRPFIVKNLFELKSAQRVLFEGNVLENVWGGFTQTGFGILLTPKNQGANECPVCEVTDVTIRYCKMRNVGSAFQIANGLSDNGATPKAGERYSIHDVVVDDIVGESFKGFGIFVQLSTAARPNAAAPPIQDVKLNHLTGFPPSGLFVVGGPAGSKMNNFTFTNSIVNGTQKEVASTGGGPQMNCAGAANRKGPEAVFADCFTHFEVRNNAIIGGAGMWPKGNYFPKKSSDVGFANDATKDYRLATTSRFKGAGSDGKDLGADIDAVESATAGVK